MCIYARQTQHYAGSGKVPYVKYFLHEAHVTSVTQCQTSTSLHSRLSNIHSVTVTSTLTHILLPTGAQRYFTLSLVTYWLQKRSVSFFRVKEPLWFDPDVKGTHSSKTQVSIYQSTRGNNPEDLNLPHSKLMHKSCTITGKEWNRNPVSHQSIT